MDLNKVMLIGRLTRDPETRTTTTGKTVCQFGMATNTSFKNASGERQDNPEYHNIVAWNKLGEIAQQYLKKGSQAYVEGRLQTRSWDGNDGQKKNRTEIVIDNLIMLGGKSGTASSSGDTNQPTPFAARGNDAFVAAEEIPTINQDQPLDEDITVEDIPF